MTAPVHTYGQGSVTVSTTATLVCTVDTENDGVLIQNAGATAVYLGGPNVTSSGATQGFSLAAGASQLVPSTAPYAHALYAITASSTSTVVFLYPVV